MKDEINVGFTKVKYDWNVGDVPELEIHFEILNLNPKIDPTRAASYLCRALKEYLELTRQDK